MSYYDKPIHEHPQPVHLGLGALGAGLIYKAVSLAHALGCREFLATVQHQNARFFERLHWRPLEKLDLFGIPRVRMQADLQHNRPAASSSLATLNQLAGFLARQPAVTEKANIHHAYAPAAVLGRASRLITSFDARPGDDLLMAVDLRGSGRGDKPFWNASVGAPPERLRADLALLPEIAERGWCRAGKDISNGGKLRET